MRPGNASTVKIALMPSRSRPTSASSTAASTCIRVRSWAIVKSVGAWRLAATVCPGSMARDTTTPSTGARISGVDQVEPRLLEGGLLLSHRGLGGLQLGLGHLESGLGRGDLGLGRAGLRLARGLLRLGRPERRLPGALLGAGRLELGLGGVEGRLGLVALALRDEVLLGEVDPAVELEASVARGGRVPGDVGLRRWR